MAFCDRNNLTSPKPLNNVSNLYITFELLLSDVRNFRISARMNCGDNGLIVLLCQRYFVDAFKFFSIGYARSDRQICFKLMASFNLCSISLSMPLHKLNKCLSRYLYIRSQNEIIIIVLTIIIISFFDTFF